MLLLEDKILNAFNILKEKLAWDDMVNYSDEDYTPILDYFNDLWNKYTLEYGATKAVVIPHNSSSVLKIPFHAFRQEVDKGNYEDDDDYDYIDTPFRNANPDCRWDYCYDELCKYEQAEKDGFADFFPKTEFYNYVNGSERMPVYKQEKVKPFFYNRRELKNNKSYETANTLIKTMEESSNARVRINVYFITECINYYGEERTQEFLKYIFITYPELGEDLHDGNLGRRDNGAPVILDFSGYRE